jgi:FAD synthetase
VLLHKLVEHIKRLGKDPRALKVYHMEPMNPFQEIEKFVEECRKFYGVDMRVIQGPIKQVLQDITGKHPELKAVFMGNRRTDPWCDKLSVFKVALSINYLVIVIDFGS